MDPLSTVEHVGFNGNETSFIYSVSTRIVQFLVRRDPVGQTTDSDDSVTGTTDTSSVFQPEL